MWQEAFKQNFIEHAKSQYPNECCGLLIDDGKKPFYMPCRNTAEKPDFDFSIHPADLATCESLGEIIGICHSHPDSTSRPSLTDQAKAYSLSTEYPKADWYIFSWPEGDLHKFSPQTESPPLIGRQFVHGIWDCYTMVRDYYKQELGIEIPDYQRADCWWEGEQELYLDNFESAGFTQVCGSAPEDLKKFDFKIGDVVLMQIRSKRVNHAAVYLGDGYMIHHLYGRLSTKEVLGGYWLRSTRAIVRYNT
ncbi:peptidase P60 [Vibrio phage VaK]|nr:peptidase P60 [Vibrio phage VaK]